MTTVYIKQNGTKVTVEVTEEIAEYLKHTRRQIWCNEAKEEYHTTSLDSMEANGSVFACSALGAEEQLIAREVAVEQRTRLKLAMRTLSQEQLKLVKMRYVDRMKLAEIAIVFGITYQAVQNRIKKILRKIRKNM